MSYFANVILGLVLAIGQQATQVDGPNPDVLDLALAGFEKAVAAGEIVRPAVLTIIDYSQPSTDVRLFVCDPETGAVIRSSLVAHGKNSGQNQATKFSNVLGSRQSSLGFYVTGDTYRGRHGYSLRLRGLEAGINDMAFKRNIVIHGAKYVSTDFADRYGRLGRSWGCPALPVESAREIIDLIKNGSCVFVYGDDSTYREKSRYIATDDD